MEIISQIPLRDRCCHRCPCLDATSCYCRIFGKIVYSSTYCDSVRLPECIAAQPRIVLGAEPMQNLSAVFTEPRKKWGAGHSNGQKGFLEIISQMPVEDRGCHGCPCLDATGCYCPIFGKIVYRSTCCDSVRLPECIAAQPRIVFRSESGAQRAGVHRDS